MPVKCSVQEVITADGLAVLAENPAAFVRLMVALTGRSTQHPPAAAGGDLAQLLDVDVDEFTAAGLCHTTNDSAGGTVQPAQFGQSITSQHSMHRGRVQAQQIADP